MRGGVDKFGFQLIEPPLSSFNAPRDNTLSKGIMVAPHTQITQIVECHVIVVCRIGEETAHAELQP